MASVFSRMARALGLTSTQALQAPQTSQHLHLRRELQSHPSRGLTPSRLAAILDQAEQGNLQAQFDLYEDMEEKDGHIGSELSKRRRAVIVDWSISPPDNPSAQELRAAELLAELLGAVPDLEDVLFDVTDAIGKGFSCAEIEWAHEQKLWLPKAIMHRPQSWFAVHQGLRQELRLRTNSLADDGSVGDALLPFGWVVHVHKAKSGLLERSAMFRQLVWPFLFKNYSVGDLAEFLEIYGIPVRIGKYHSGASEAEKLTLLRALAGIGHNASAIVPSGMELEFMEAARGDPQGFKLMIDWCERTQSKVILGATLTSGSDGASSTNALGKIHNEVRKDLRDSDIRQLCSTITRDLIYPMAALNGLAPEGLRRCPVFQLNVGETEDLTAFADALPKLVGIGMQVPVQWAQERLGIPQPQAGEAVLGEVHAPLSLPSAQVGRGKGVPPLAPAKAPALALLTAGAGAYSGNDAPDQSMLDAQLQAATTPADLQAQMEAFLAPVAMAMLHAQDDPQALLGWLTEHFPDLTDAQLQERLARAMFAAAVWGQLYADA